MTTSQASWKAVIQSRQASNNKNVRNCKPLNPRINSKFKATHIQNGAAKATGRVYEVQHHGCCFDNDTCTCTTQSHHLTAKETTIIHPFGVVNALCQVTWVAQNRSYDENHPSARLYEVGHCSGVLAVDVLGFVDKFDGSRPWEGLTKRIFTRVLSFFENYFEIMKVVAVPSLEDNYAYLVFDEETGDAVAIDPVWPDEVLQAAQSNGVKIKMVLTTHHHWDHAGGNSGMKKLLKDVPIYGGMKDKVEACSHPVQHGDEVSISPTIRVKCLETPCHTKGHISYYFTSTRAEDKSAVFTGDTLFIGGCGRFFEGTPDQMYKSLCKTLASLPPETEVYCGHEYTQKNLEFALTLEPKNDALLKKMDWVVQQRNQKLPTVPSTIGDELEFNPFMRVEKKSLQLATGRESPVEVMAEVRRMKDNYRGKISVL